MIDAYRQVVAQYAEAADRFATLAEGTYGTEVLAEYGKDAVTAPDIDQDAISEDVGRLIGAWAGADQMRRLENRTAQKLYEHVDSLSGPQQAELNDISQDAYDAEQCYRTAKRRLANTEIALGEQGVSVWDLRARMDPSFIDLRAHQLGEFTRGQIAEELEHDFSEVENLLLAYHKAFEQDRPEDIEPGLLEGYFEGLRENIHAADDHGIDMVITDHRDDPRYGERYQNLATAAKWLDHELDAAGYDLAIDVPDLSSDDPEQHRQSEDRFLVPLD